MSSPDPAAVQAFASTLEAAVPQRVRRDFPLAPLTTFRIGGPASVYLEPESLGDLEAVAAALSAHPVPFVIIGKGSNVLVADTGFDGLVLRLGKQGFRFVARDGDLLTAGGAMPVPALAGVAAQHGLGGLEFGAAIPASLGGAVKMNAGAHGHEMSEVMHAVQLFSLSTAGTSEVTAADAGFTYRRSSLPPDALVIGASMLLAPGDPQDIRRHMDEARDWRKRTQPLAEPNCGSVFKNPQDDAAARLVEAAGGKAIRVGGATVSQKHANFIVAEPGATAADVVAVIQAVQDRVNEGTGIMLEPEVHLIGEFAETPR